MNASSTGSAVDGPGVRVVHGQVAAIGSANIATIQTPGPLPMECR